MTFQMTRSRMLTAALVLAMLSVGRPLFAQLISRTTAPAKLFEVEKLTPGRLVSDLPGGRLFRGGDNRVLVVRGVIQQPREVVPFKLSKFIVHFRTRDTTRLFTVELLSDSRVIYRSRTLAQGDYLTKEQLTPDYAANAFQFPPIALHGPIEIRLLISGLQGSGENLPGDFFLVGVDAEFIRQGLGTGETTTSVDKRLPAGAALPPPVVVPTAPEVLSPDVYALRGKAIADAIPLVGALRESEPGGPIRTGFDIGMGAWFNQTADGAGKQTLAKSLTAAEQSGFADAAVFSLQWNTNVEFASVGADIAAADPEVAAARAKARGTPPNGLRAALYWLGFDIATGIFGNPAPGSRGERGERGGRGERGERGGRGGRGGRGNMRGAESDKIRATLGPDAQQGFDDSMAFNIGRR